MINKISLKKLLDRWSVDRFELSQIIYEGELEVYQRLDIYSKFGQSAVPLGRKAYRKVKKEKLNRIFSFQEIEALEIYFVFKNDIEAFEDKHPEINSSYSDKDARLLGQLKREKEKWSLSLEAAIKIGLYLSTINNEITRNDLFAKLDKDGFSDLPDTTIEKIWKAIPNNYKKSAGRPKKHE